MRIKRVLWTLVVVFVVGLLFMSSCGWSLLRAIRSTSGPAITVSKETTFIEEPLDEEGKVDYVAALNAISSDGVTPENNAVVLFWQAFGPGRPSEQIPDRFFAMIGMERPLKDGRYLIAEEDYRPREPAAGDANAEMELAESDKETNSADECHKQLSHAAKFPWSRDERPVVAEFLDLNTVPLEIIIEGTRRPKYYAPLVATKDQRTILDIFLPTQQRCREPARFLIARAMLHLGEGKTDEAWQDLLACHRMARLVAQGPLHHGRSDRQLDRGAGPLR